MIKTGQLHHVFIHSISIMLSCLVLLVESNRLSKVFYFEFQYQKFYNPNFQDFCHTFFDIFGHEANDISLLSNLIDVRQSVNNANKATWQSDLLLFLLVSQRMA